MSSQVLWLVQRWGLESWLVVGALYAYFRVIGREDLTRAVRWGTIAGVIGSLAATPIFNAAPDQLLIQAILIVLASGLVAVLAAMARPTSRTFQSHGRQEVGTAFYVILAFTVFSIMRRGIQVGGLVGWILFDQAPLTLWIEDPSKAAPLILGLAGGLGLAALYVWAWAYFAPRLFNRDAVVEMLTVFSLFFVPVALLSGLHYFAEVYHWEAFHAATEDVSPDGIYGKRFPYLMMILPLLWAAVRTFVVRPTATGPARVNAKA